MKFSFHVCNVPCPEEYYMGVSADYEAYEVDIPDELFPKELLDVLYKRENVVGPNGQLWKRLTNIAPHAVTEINNKHKD